MWGVQCVRENNPPLSSSFCLQTGVNSKHVSPRLLILCTHWEPGPNTKNRGIFFLFSLNLFSFFFICVSLCFPFIRCFRHSCSFPCITISPSLYLHISVCVCACRPLSGSLSACQCCAMLAETMLGIFLSASIYLLMVMLVRVRLHTCVLVLRESEVLSGNLYLLFPFFIFSSLE